MSIRKHNSRHTRYDLPVLTDEVLANFIRWETMGEKDHPHIEAMINSILLQAHAEREQAELAELWKWFEQHQDYEVHVYKFSGVEVMYNEKVMLDHKTCMDPCTVIVKQNEFYKNPDRPGYVTPHKLYELSLYAGTRGFFHPNNKKYLAMDYPF